MQIGLTICLLYLSGEYQKGYTMKTIQPIRFNETDCSVEGLFVKGISRIEPTCLKTPVLMVHGACHGWWAYHKWLPFYATAGWNAYSMSLRNHTGSYSVPEEKYLKLGSQKDAVLEEQHILPEEKCLKLGSHKDPVLPNARELQVHD